MSSSAGARVGPELGGGHGAATLPDERGASGAPIDDAPTLTDQPARAEVWRARAAGAALLALVFGSGFAGLVYQMIFIRLSVLVFGATVDAVSTVVAAFVAGLAAGSVWGGRLADRVRRPLLIYGLVEGAVGLLCVGVPLYFKAVGAAYGAWAVAAPDSGLYTTTLRIALSALVIVPAAFLMGASLPLVARHCVRGRVGAAGSALFSGIYGSNTLGAAAGVLAATYLLLPAWGVTGALWLAVAVNLTVAGVVVGWQRLRVLAVHRRRAAEAAAAGGAVPQGDAWDEPSTTNATPLRSTRPLPAPAAAAATPAPVAAGAPPRLAGVAPVLLVAFFSGYLAFSLEVVWTHLLHLTVGGTAYVVGAILFVVLLGLGLGAAALAPVLRRSSDPGALLAGALALTGLALAVHLPLWNRLPDLFVPLGPLRLGFAARELVRFAMIAGAVLVPAVLLGTVFPLAVGLALGDPARIGRSIGRLYAVNSAGSILGPVVAGFLVLPRVGSEWALRGHALIYALLAVPLLWVVRRGRPPAEGRRRAAVVLALAGAGVLASALMPRWDPRPLTSGANVYFTAGFRGYDRLLHFRESVSGGVTTVVEKDGVRTLLSNGKFQGTTGPESFFQTNMALVPMTQLRRTERGLNIGLGTGQTLATMAAAPFARIDVAEISPDVVEAARWYFSGLHRGSIDDPRVHVSYADGRNFLMVQAAQARYDLIAVQLNSIWLAGAAALYSREFYQLCLRRLADGGILQQWLQLHHMRWEDIVTVMATMADVFPQVALWQFGHQAIVLGSNRPLLADHARLRALEPRLKAAGALDGFASPRVLAAFAYHHLDDAAFRALLRDAIPKERAAEFISSDLRPRLEYGTPRGVTETDSAALFHRRTRPYSFAPLEALIAGVPPGEKAAALQAIDDERRAALPGETRKKVVAPAIEGHP